VNAVPLQNRVLPTGEIVAHPARATLMGNRGCIHRPDRTLGVTRWRSKLWICCTLSWKDVRRDVMPPGRWTALFFLDEPTALAAGHRPCAYCRRADYVWYAESWPRRLKAFEMDAVLHTERVHPYSRRQRTHHRGVGELPDGVMVHHDGSPALLVNGRALPWSFDGYGEPARLRRGAQVEVLTPPSNVAAIAAGYRPLVHPSAPPSPGLRRFVEQAGSLEASRP
jgi:hypothetical protein